MPLIVKHSPVIGMLLVLLGQPVLGQLVAGVAKEDITDRRAGPVNDPLFVKALVLRSAETQVAIVTVDAVAIGGIGRIGDDYLPKVRQRVQDAIGLPPENLLIVASHCHGVVSSDVVEKTVAAITRAASRTEKVTIGVGTGQEDRIMENRRLIMKDGREIDVRHAYSMPADQDVARLGPVDPEIGVLRIDRVAGSTMAVVYNFACHPIQGVPGQKNSADLVGYASAVLEQALGPDCMALFLQGCGGDINPVKYKDVDHPRHAEPLGNMLGLSTLKAAQAIETADDERLHMLSEQLLLPRANLAERIIQLESRRDTLVRSLRGTTLSLKTFVPLLIKYRLSEDFPAYYSHGYLHEKEIGRDDLVETDRANRAALERYVRNVLTMEELTRVNTNLDLLKKHQQQNMEAGSRNVEVQLTALRVGDFVLTSFPGELVAQIGINLKKTSPHRQTFIAGYANGYIYYAPTTKQLDNRGGAQEDSDCILAPHWQGIYEKKALEMLGDL